MFSRFLLFFANGRRRALRGGDRPAETWCGGARPARIWCTIPRKTLFLRFLYTKFGCLFSDRPARTWCTNPRKTQFLRFLCTKSY